MDPELGTPRHARGLEPVETARDSKLIRYWLPVLAWAVFIFSFSSIPNPPVPHAPGLHMDKILHMIGYGMLGALLFRAFAKGEKMGNQLCVVLTILFSTAYGMSDETHQFFVGRDCDLGDLIADFAGATIAASAFVVWIRRRGSLERSEFTLQRAGKETLNTLKREL